MASNGCAVNFRHCKKIARSWIGKSRLRQEVLRVVTERYRDIALMVARPDAFRTHSVYSLLSGALRNILQISAGELDSFLLAEHFQRGRDLENAAIHYLRAGNQAFERDDLAGALLSVQRGLACAPKGELFGNLQALATMTHCWRSELVLRLMWIRTLLVRGLCRVGQLADALAVATDIERMFETSSGGYVEVNGWLAIAETYAANGDMDAARHHLARAMQSIDIRASDIPNEDMHDRFLHDVVENARVRALAVEWR